MVEIKILIFLAETIMSISVGCIIVLLLKNRINDEDIIKAKEIVQKRIVSEREEKYKKYLFRNELSYEKKVVYLAQVGATHHIGRNITPTSLLICKVFAAIFFSISGISLLGMFGIIMGVIGYYLPELLLNFINKYDNAKMLPDIKELYDSMLISLESGMFLTKAFAESYRVVQNKRLKQAILELNAEIIATNDMEKAINGFESKFKNPYISELAVILRQQTESGLSVEMMTDMSKQMEDVTKALNIKKKEKLDGEGFLVEISLFVGIIAVCLYICFYMLLTTMSQL